MSVIRAELEAALGADVVLVDRPLPDAIGYLEAALETQCRNISSSEHDYLYSLARIHGARYSLLLKTNLDTSMPLGEYRDRDLAFRELVDKKIAASLEALQLPNHSFHYRDTELMLDLVLKTIGDE